MRLRIWRPLGTATAAFAHILAVVEVDLVVLSKEVQAGQVSRDEDASRIQVGFPVPTLEILPNPTPKADCNTTQHIPVLYEE